MQPRRSRDRTQEAPPIIVMWYELVMWLMGKTEKFPRRVRFTFANRIDNLALDILEQMVTARYEGVGRGKLEALGRADSALSRLRILLRMCHDLKYLDHGGYEHAARGLTEAGGMLGGWIKHVEQRL